MLASLLTSSNTENSSGNLILSGEVTVVVQVVDVVTTRDGVDNKITRNVHRKYDLNNPYEYGAFVEDGYSGFIEEGAAGFISAWSELRDPNTTAERKGQILDSGKPYQYPNTKRLAVVKPENNSFYFIDQKRPAIYVYNYDNACEKIDFDSKVIPGTNNKLPLSPCNTIVVSDDTGSRDTPNQVEVGLMSNTFTDFDDYARGFSTVFSEIGFRSGSVGAFNSFNPPRFQFVSQSRIVDVFDDVQLGPVRVVEEESAGIMGSVITDLVIYQSVLSQNRRTGAISSGSSRDVEIYRRRLFETPNEVSIYKEIGSSEIQRTTLYNTTDGAWNGIGQLYNFHTSSMQSSLDKSYKLEVHSGSCGDTKMFTIYYGDTLGGGTFKISDDRKKLGYSKSVYSMFNSLVGNTIHKKISFVDNSSSQSLNLQMQLNGLTSSIGDFVNSNFINGYNINDNSIIDFKDGIDGIFVSGSDFYYKSGIDSTNRAIKLKSLKNVDRIYAIQVNPNLLKNAIDEGNFELNLAQIITSGSPDPNNSSIMPPIGGWGIHANVDMNSDKVIRLIDTSREYDIVSDQDINDSYRFKSGFTTSTEFDIVSGSLENGIHSNQSPIVYGKLYPGYGLIILDATKLDTELNFGLISNLNVNAENPLRLYTSIKGAATQTNVRTTTYPFIIRQVEASVVDSFEIVLTKNDFNYSTNPSYYAERERSPFFRPAGQTTFANGRLAESTLRFRQWFYDPITYITTVGLYNDDYELLAIGKMSKPIKKSFSDSIRIKVNIKY